MGVVTYSKEEARRALKAFSHLRGDKADVRRVREFLEAVERFFPSEESYKRRPDEETSKQRRRKEQLNPKEKRREEGKKKRGLKDLRG